MRTIKEQPYAPNTRETFRRQVLHQFLQARIVDYNPDNPALPVNSPNAHYKLTEEAYETIKSYNTQEWEIKAQNFNDAVGRLIEEYEKSREMEMIPVTIEGKEFKLSPGKHNEVQAAVINEFALVLRQAQKSFISVILPIKTFIVTRSF